MKKAQVLISVVLFVFCLAVPAFADNGHGPGNGSEDGWHGYGDHQIDHNLILPQIAVGQHYTTTLFFISLGNTERMPWAQESDFETRGTAYFFRQDGSPYTALVNGQGPVSEFPFVIGAGESLTLKLTGQGEDTPGWALVKIEEDASDNMTWGNMDGHEVSRGMRLTATAFYSLRDDSAQLASQVGVMPAMYERGHYLTSVVPAQSGESLDTGVAIVNTSGEAVTARLRLKDLSGATIATAEISLPAGNQTAKFITELFPGQVPDNFQGSLEVSTDGEGIVTLGLLMAEGVLTSIPSHHFGEWNNDDMGGGGMMVP